MRVMATEAVRVYILAQEEFVPLQNWLEDCAPVNPFPDEVARFLDANVESVDQLEILRLLGEDAQKEWNATDLAREVQVTPQVLVKQLAALQGRGLLQTITRGADVYCCLCPGTPELDQQLRLLLQIYRERPVTTINRVSSRARSALQSFADAFRIRKEE